MSCPKNLSADEFRSNRLVCLLEDIARQHSIQVVTRLLIVAFSRQSSYSDNKSRCTIKAKLCSLLWDNRNGVVQARPTSRKASGPETENLFESSVLKGEGLQRAAPWQVFLA